MGIIAPAVTDVAPGSTYWPAVQMVSAHRFMVGQGGGHFGIGDTTVARQDIAVGVARRFAYDLSDRGINTLDQNRLHPPNSGQTIGDVASSSSYYPYIAWLFTENLFSGCGGSQTSFCPAAAATRGDVVSFLGPALTGSSTCSGQYASPANTFADLQGGSTLYNCANALVNAGMMFPQSGNMKLGNNITRADFTYTLAVSVLMSPSKAGTGGVLPPASSILPIVSTSFPLQIAPNNP
jgi:hypothetical protein